MEVNNTLLKNLDHLGSWGILTTDVDSKITGWNRWLEKHTGQKSEQVVGRTLFDVFPELVIRGLDRYYSQALTGQSGILSQRFHAYLLPMPPTVASASLMNMQQTAKINPLMEGERIIGTLTLIEDVTERVATEFELRQQAQSLEDANRHKDEFLAMLAHELRNPLAPIRNGIRLLDHVATESSEARDTRQMIERQVTHMARLIDDLMDVSRIVRGKVRLQKEPCDLVQILRDVAHDYEAILADNGLTLFAELPTEPCWMEGDVTRLSQVISNLLHNANKFTNKGGRVWLKAKIDAAASLITISVQDDGIGMSAETVAKVFDTFSQAESSLARSKGGLGLGLALVKGLVELHEGRVEAYSSGLGKGSEFRVRLPLKKAAPLKTLTAPVPTTEKLQPKRVLVIEDNRDTALSMKMLLRHMGFDVQIAHSGPDGVELAKRILPDVILCDLGLPELDGFGVARTLRSDAATCDMLLIAQSGYGQENDILKSREAGFDLHLVKPIDFLQLQGLITSAENRRLKT
ncbi:Autoinducer 2 sensor kinase/phosphatase LuxQ [Anatilimnocola aggregata]|uniref:histidine kinase n=1 Tax=Anatilimnocola aggregata TaxID=2528021 RepID=A0A517YFD4_9BACT|nr:ATP-binding protein [Anatilimnocola aggregata]QDU28921.1 Autoinducer 2 sensor kinase/phosphatase LuxQ [Anatilimnocola aggregata]